MLRKITRRNRPNDEIQKLVGRARAANMVVNVDLVVGLPEQTMPSFQSDVLTAIELGVNSITTYRYIPSERLPEDASPDMTLQRAFTPGFAWQALRRIVRLPHAASFAWHYLPSNLPAVRGIANQLSDLGVVKFHKDAIPFDNMCHIVGLGPGAFSHIFGHSWFRESASRARPRARPVGPRRPAVPGGAAPPRRARGRGASPCRTRTHTQPATRRRARRRAPAGAAGRAGRACRAAVTGAVPRRTGKPWPSRLGCWIPGDRRGKMARMAAPKRIRRRLALAIVVTAVIPLLVAVLLAGGMLRTATARFYTPEVGSHLDRSLGLYQELARTVKSAMRLEAAAIADKPEIRKAAAEGDRIALQAALRAQFKAYSNLVSLAVEDAGGTRIAFADRGHPLDPKKENALEVRRPLVSDPAADENAPELVAVFAADKARFEELDEMSQFVDTYKKIERGRHGFDQSFVQEFAALLGITILAAVGVGNLLARGVSSRISDLAEATTRVGAGDLSIRVPEAGSDEIADLARAFNRMLGEVESSRARIEYLQRIGAWQEMARRLAHEIKNPLTPIQLAVQEVHRRYGGDDAAYTKLLDTTLEIVEDEVGTLRRLVSEFSGFARMPQAQLEEHDLAAFLADQRDRLGVLDDESLELGGDLPGESNPHVPGATVEFELPDQAVPVYLDKQMLRRALINLVRNAGQAIQGAGRDDGRVVVRLSRDGDFRVIDIDDNGPGIPEEMRDTVFDPYVTTKTDGTGLGLAIVKKIVVEHGGSIRAEKSPLGGARMHISLPGAGTAAGTAALEARDWHGPPSSGRPAREPGS